MPCVATALTAHPVAYFAAGTQARLWSCSSSRQVAALAYLWSYLWGLAYSNQTQLPHINATRANPKNVGSAVLSQNMPPNHQDALENAGARMGKVVT